MKKITLIGAAVLAAIAFASCNKQNLPDTIEGEGDMIVSISDGPSTKAPGDQGTNDQTINNAQVFVFNTKTGQIDNAIYKTFTGASGSCTMPSLRCTFGQKEIWAVVNAPKDYVTDGSVKTVADLKAIAVNLKDNTLNNLIMVGKLEGSDANFNDVNKNVTIEVSRLVAAVVLKTVRNEMQVPAYRSKVVVTGAYLMNVPGVQKLDGSVLSNGTDSPLSSWYARYAKAGSEDPVALLAETFTEATVDYMANDYSAPHTFYSFANVYDKVRGQDSKTERSSTYLIVECKVDGTPCVYPVLLPKLEANKKYEVSLKIQHVGQDPEAPWKKVDFVESFTAGINIKGWGTAVSVTEEI